MKRALLAFVILATFLVLPAASLEDTPSKYRRARQRMVDHQVRLRGVSDGKVLAAMAAVPRHRFVPQALKRKAYEDHPLPIGSGQTISQPYIVGLMTEALKLKANDHILEIGTGSGYQAAVLAKIVKMVTTIEIKEKLHKRAANILGELGYNNVEPIHGDGYFGQANAAPFDGIMVTAAVDHIPPPLLKQLKDGARLILPLGNPFSYQNLVLITKKGDDFITKQITGVLFVPLTGHALDKNNRKR
ncbi:MAG: protein-L-isoaspartate(D-aspartate) O-methyltransferase [Desulfobacterales bacterium]